MLLICAYAPGKIDNRKLPGVKATPDWFRFLPWESPAINMMMPGPTGSPVAVLPGIVSFSLFGK
jgi:hypothetical protein